MRYNGVISLKKYVSFAVSKGRPPMALHPTTDTAPEMLRATVVALVAGEHVDLTTRQLAVFLICYLDDGPHTVRGWLQLFKSQSQSSPARSTGSLKWILPAVGRSLGIDAASW